MSTVRIDDMTDEIMRHLERYAELAALDVKEAVSVTAKECRKEISKNAPRDTGQYAKTWRTKVTAENAVSRTVTVYSSAYQLVHLLEHGHITRNGTGRTQAQPHVAPAEEHAGTALEERIRTMLENIEV